MRIFLDANVLFSAARADGVIRRLLSESQTRKHALVVGQLVVVEARRNLERKASSAAVVFLELLLQSIDSSDAVPRLVATDIDWLVEKDRHVLCAAIHMRCDVLMSGDFAHFGAGYGRTFDSVKILSPRMTAELLLPASTS